MPDPEEDQAGPKVPVQTGRFRPISDRYPQHCRLRLFASDFWIRLSNPLRALLRLLSLLQILRPVFWVYLLLPPVLEPRHYYYHHDGY